MPVVKLSAAIKAGYALSLLGSAGLPRKEAERGCACVYTGFKPAMYGEAPNTKSLFLFRPQTSDL